MVFREALTCFLLAYYIAISQIFCATPKSEDDYKFAALLLDSENSQLGCLGAIISDRWIIDSCADRSWYKFKYAKVGWMGSEFPDMYIIALHVLSKHYKEIPFLVNGTKMTQLYATTHGIFLHKTQKSIKFTSNVAVIDILQDFKLPNEAQAVYFSNKSIISQQLPVIRNRVCDRKLVKYFQPEHPIEVKSPLYCVATHRIAPNHCCQSQALMILKDQLVGVMAWSTACSEEFGVDPWVFSQVAFYMEWIKNVTNWEKRNANTIYRTSA